MSINPVSTKNNPRASYYKRAALNGAVGTVGILGLTTSIDHFLRPATIQKTMEELGGRNKYIKNFIATAGVFALIGAAINTATAFIIEKTASRK